jgi:HEAT repeat protein
MDGMNSLRIALLLTSAVALTGCASDGGGSSRSSSSGGSTASQTDVERPTPDEGTVRTFDESTNEFMENGLRQFSAGDARWPETRQRWLAMGKRESDFLVSAMFAGLLAAQRANAPDLVQRARHELVLIGEPSVDFLAGILGTGTVDTIYDEIEQKEKPIRVDDDTRREAAEILALIGGPAAPATAGVVGSAETKSGRRFALQALGNMGDRGGRAAADALVRWSRADDWVLRVEAVNGMRHFSDAGTRAGLEEALGDDERLVREKAVDGLRHRNERASLPALRRALSTAQSHARIREAQRIEATIARIQSP